MNEEALICRITAHPGIFGGKPILRSGHVPVDHVLHLLASGQSADTILKRDPRLKRDDIRACLAYARRLVASEQESVESQLLDMAA